VAVAGNINMWVGLLSVDVVFGDVHSLKEKRSLVRPVVAELRRRFPVSAAEVDHHDLHRRAKIGVSVVAADRGFCADVLDGCERMVAERPELEVVETRRRYLAEDDLDGDSGFDRGFSVGSR
jgi:uncharacterized protein YlxP (DUF503 family)